jgi:hypothetical protein
MNNNKSSLLSIKHVFWQTKKLIIVMCISGPLFGQADVHDKSYYDLVNSIIENSVSRKVLVIDSAKSAFEFFNPKDLTFYTFSSPEARQMILSDSVWVRTLRALIPSAGILHEVSSFDPKKVQLASHSDINEFWTPDGFLWKNYKQKYKTEGFMEFSTIFEFQGHGIMYYDIRRGPLNGGGSVLFLEKLNGNWEIKEILTTWVE